MQRRWIRLLLVLQISLFSSCASLPEHQKADAPIYCGANKEDEKKPNNNKHCTPGPLQSDPDTLD